jgi:hypothetical protein
MRCQIHGSVDTLQDNWYAAGLLPRQIMRKLVRQKVAPTSRTSSAICLKELRASRCWIRLIIKTEMLPEHRVGELLDECNQLCNIIARSIVTTKGKAKKAVAAG